MAKKRKTKRKYRATHEVPVTENGRNVLGKPFRYKKPPPTELETTASLIGRLINDIQSTRRRIGHIEQSMTNERETLANLMLEHQAAVAKSKDLSLIPQPL